MLSSYATPFELSHGFRLSKITRLFAHPTLLPVALQVAKEVGFPKQNIYVLGNHDVPGRTSFGQLVDRVLRSQVPRVAVHPVKKDTLAYLVFSSGTSGLPKGELLILILLDRSNRRKKKLAVMISHGNLVCTMHQLLIVMQEMLIVYEV
jgi:long-subunit acyl-CoA synthetase (AMP-forming)